MKKKANYLVVNIILLFMVIEIISILPNTVESLQTIGTVIIIVSICMMVRYKKNNCITLLIGIMSMISICFSLSVCFNTYDTAFNWQLGIINTEENIMNAKSYLLFITILSISIGHINEKISKEEKENYNLIIAILGFLILICILIWGFDRGNIEKYHSNTNVLYEYAIVLFIFVWCYGKKNKIIKILLFLYAIIYCLQGLIYGDRSSAFPMILMIFLLIHKENYNMKYIILIGLGGIFLANMIDILRNNADVFNYDTMSEVFDRGLFVNTISYAFYGGTQVIRYGVAYPSEVFMHFLRYMLSFIIGGSNKNSLTVIADSMGFSNSGGGMTHAYLFYWRGYIGNIIGAIIMGRIIHYVFNNDNKYTKVLKITITVFLIRWFLYYPLAFFRTSLFIPIVCCIVFDIAEKFLNEFKNGVRNE